MRGLLRDVPDLLARLRSLADPMKAAVLDPVRVSTSSVEPAAPVGADLLDAMRVVEVAVSWSHDDLTRVSNNLDEITYLGGLLLDRHPEDNGLREAWSVQDVMDKWGVERRDTGVYVFPTDDEDDEPRSIPEWFNPLLTVAQHADRLKVSQRAVQKWVKDEGLEPAVRMRGPRGSVLSCFYATVIDAAAAAAKQRGEASKFGAEAKTA
nr:hypothetical protein [Rhodococcus erythropolis]